MSEHLLFLQSAGSDFSSAHDLVTAVADVGRRHHSIMSHGHTPDRGALYSERLAARIERAGYEWPDSLIIALATILTVDSPRSEADADWISAAADRIGDPDLLVEAAGVVFAFNTINRIADARRVPLEFGFLRKLKPFHGWIERRLVSLTGLAYDMSFKHQARHSSGELLERAGVLLNRLGRSDVPDVLHWLSRSPVVLEGVLEMLESNVTSATVNTDLLKEAIAIGAASRAMPGSGLSRLVEQWIPSEALGDAQSLRAWANPAGVADTDLVTACRRYAWQVANAAYTITDEQIRELTALGLSDAELLDLTLATAVFSALAIIEPLSKTVAPPSIAADKTLDSRRSPEVQVQLA